jgi:flagellar motor protein MotB
VKKAFPILLLVLVLAACSSYKNQVISLQQHIEGMKGDSILLEKRIEKLKEDNQYLSIKAATVEQAYINRLKEKEDSLEIRKQQIADRENQIADIQARREEEREAFKKLANSVFDEFKKLGFDTGNLQNYTECSQIIVEIHDRNLFVPLSTKTAAGMPRVLKQVADVLNKHQDLALNIVVYADSTITTREKIEDSWDWTQRKATILGKQLKNEFGILPVRFYISTQAVYQTMPAPKMESTQKVVFIFRSGLVPCLQ